MRIVALLLFIISIFSCQDSASNQNTAEMKAREDSLLHEVIEGHDVGMAKMKSLKNAIAGTQAKLDSLNKLPAAGIDTTYHRALVDLQEDLSYAEYGMNQWMNEFKLDSAEGNSGLRIKYLESEKGKVTKVRDNILNGLARADSLLNGPLPTSPKR